MSRLQVEILAYYNSRMIIREFMYDINEYYSDNELKEISLREHNNMISTCKVRIKRHCERYYYTINSLIAQNRYYINFYVDNNTKVKVHNNREMWRHIDSYFKRNEYIKFAIMFDTSLKQTFIVSSYNRNSESTSVLKQNKKFLHSEEKYVKVIEDLSNALQELEAKNSKLEKENILLRKNFNKQEVNHKKTISTLEHLYMKNIQTLQNQINKLNTNNEKLNKIISKKKIQVNNLHTKLTESLRKNKN